MDISLEHDFVVAFNTKGHTNIAVVNFVYDQHFAAKALAIKLNLSFNRNNTVVFYRYLQKPPKILFYICSIII